VVVPEREPLEQVMQVADSSEQAWDAVFRVLEAGRDML
jgi:hypothetical protein